MRQDGKQLPRNYTMLGDALQHGNKGRYSSCVRGREIYVLPLLHMGHI